MLKVTILGGGAERTLKVEGKLAEPSVSQLESAWKQALHAGDARRIEVDLSDVTFIDPTGEAALMEMIAGGARLTAKGVYSEYVVDRLMKRAQKSHAIRDGRNGAGVKHSAEAVKRVRRLKVD